jgi:hypothetical protein
VKQRRAWSSEVLQVRHQRPQLAEEARQQADALAQVGAPLGRRLAVALAWTMKSANDSFSRAQRAEVRCRESAHSAGRASGSGCEDIQHLVGLAQGRVRAVDHLVEVAAAAREAGA